MHEDPSTLGESFRGKFRGANPWRRGSGRAWTRARIISAGNRASPSSSLRSALKEEGDVGSDLLIFETGTKGP
jgi:hypothetical protein